MTFTLRYLNASADASKVSTLRYTYSDQFFTGPFARQATDIDPGYARAWARLASANMVGSSRPPLSCKREILNLSCRIVPLQGLNSIDQAIGAWTRALDALQKENLTPAEQKQKDQYGSELAAAKAKLEDLKANPKQPEGMTTVPASENDKLPWNRALALIPGLDASGTWDSSVRHVCTYPLSRCHINALSWLCLGMGNRESIQGKPALTNLHPN